MINFLNKFKLLKWLNLFLLILLIFYSFYILFKNDLLQNVNIYMGTFH